MYLLTLLFKKVETVGYKSFASIVSNNNLLVLDNSVVMRWFFNDGSDEDLEYAEKVLRRIKKGHLTLVAPSLWLSEASFVTRSYVKREIVKSQIVVEKLTEAFNFFSVVECHFNAVELFDFSTKFNLSSYDANYALLANKLNCPLATLDRKLRKIMEQSGGLILDI